MLDRARPAGAGGRAGVRYRPVNIAQPTRTLPGRLRYAASHLVLAPLRAAHRLDLFLRYRRSREPSMPCFVVCTLRTGSNLLLSYLNSIPGLSFAGEILHPDHVGGVPRRGISKLAVIRHIRYSLIHCRNERCGAKLPADHLKWHDLDVRQLHEHFPAAKFLILYRRSLAEQYLSLQVARATGRWVRRRAAAAARPRRAIRIHRDDCLKYCRLLKEFYSRTLRVEGIGSYALVLSYEELVANAQDVFNKRIFPFLGLTPSEIATDLVRLNSKPPSEVVEDYASVKDLWEHPECFQEYELH